MKLPKKASLWWDGLNSLVMVGVGIFLLYFNYEQFSLSKDSKTAIELAVVGYLVSRIRASGE